MSVIVKFLPWIQIGLSGLLIASILMQQSAAALGSAFGGGDSAAFHTRRGFEKFSFYLTIIVAVLFALAAIAAVVI